MKEHTSYRDESIPIVYKFYRISDGRISEIHYKSFITYCCNARKALSKEEREIYEKRIFPTFQINKKMDPSCKTNNKRSFLIVYGVKQKSSYDIIDIHAVVQECKKKKIAYQIYMVGKNGVKRELKRLTFNYYYSNANRGLDPLHYQQLQHERRKASKAARDANKITIAPVVEPVVVVEETKKTLVDKLL